VVFVIVRAVLEISRNFESFGGRKLLASPRHNVRRAPAPHKKVEGLLNQNQAEGLLNKSHTKKYNDNYKDSVCIDTLID